MTKHIVNRFDFETVVAGVFKIIENPHLYTKYKKMLEANLFFFSDSSPRIVALRKIINWLHDMSEAKKTNTPSLVSFGSYINSYIIPSDANKEATDLFFSMVSSSQVQIKLKDPAEFDTFKDYLRLLRFIKYSSQIFEEYQSGNVDGAADFMRNTLSDLALLENEQGVEFSIEKDFDNIILNRKTSENIKTLYFGYAPLDSCIGGFEQSTLNIFISASGGGKSMTNHHIISRCIEQKIRVHVTCVEDRMESFVRKLTACLTGIPINSLKSFVDPQQTRIPTSDERSLILKAKKLIDEYVKVDFIYGVSIDTVHKRKQEYDLYCIANNLPLPVVDIVDYTGHISGKARGEKMFEQMRNAYGERKDYALQNGKICFDFAQVNREGSKRMGDDGKKLGFNDLAGSFDLAQVCDNIISINRGALEIETLNSVFKIAKARDGDVSHEFQIKTNFAAAQYLVDHPGNVWLTGKDRDMESLREMDTSKIIPIR